MNCQDARPAERSPDIPPQAKAFTDAPPAAQASAVRGAPEWRHLSFRTSGLTIELEITGTGNDRKLMGQLIPRQCAAVDIRHSDGVITVEADELGQFSAEAVPLGQISLRCHLGPEAGHSDVLTGWITL